MDRFAAAIFEMRTGARALGTVTGRQGPWLPWWGSRSNATLIANTRNALVAAQRELAAMADAMKHAGASDGEVAIQLQNNSDDFARERNDIDVLIRRLED
jgi:hypothetical protein